MAFEMEDRLAELRGRGGEVEETPIQVYTCIHTVLQQLGFM